MININSNFCLWVVEISLNFRILGIKEELRVFFGII